MNTQKIFRFVLALVLLAPMLLAKNDAFAEAPTRFRVRLNDATVPWFGPRDSSCPGIPEGVLIDSDELGSDRLKQAIQTQLSDGTIQVVVNDLITGTATDNFGTGYSFVYKNDATLVFDGSTVSVRMKDVFRLTGGNVDYTVKFIWKWAYEADSLQVFEILDGNGQAIDLGVDPFPFATNDGVTENPDIIPGSWQQILTEGEIFACDPL